MKKKKNGSNTSRGTDVQAQSMQKIFVESREISGNFVLDQGKMELKPRSCQGTLCALIRRKKKKVGYV